jgi:aldose 1-epimerase
VTHFTDSSAFRLAGVPEAPPAAAACERAAFGAGQESVDVITLRNGTGITATLLSYGATLVSLKVPDREGRLGEVVLGFSDPQRYAGEHPFLGSTVGSFANRIAHARFTLDGHSYALERNDGVHHLHGGSSGFHRKHWHSHVFVDGPEVCARFSCTSLDGEGGYPGELHASVCYRLSPTGALRIDFEVVTDRSTVLNMTHHSYFNLRDGGRGDVLGHRLWLAAERYLAIDANGLPTGEVLSVKSTALDFRKPRAIGSGIAATELHTRSGYDHCFLLPESTSDAPRLAARLIEPSSGRALEVLTTQPALQLYTGNNLDGSIVGHAGARYQRHAGLCLETQHCPDAPNHPEFGSTRLDPGGRYAHSVVYRFGIVEGSAVP